MYIYFVLLILSACQITTRSQSGIGKNIRGFLPDYTFTNRLGDGTLLRTWSFIENQSYGEVFIGRNRIPVYSFDDKNAEVDCYPTEYKDEYYVDILENTYEDRGTFIQMKLKKRARILDTRTRSYITNKAWMCFNKEKTVQFVRVHNVLNAFLGFTPRVIHAYNEVLIELNKERMEWESKKDWTGKIVGDLKKYPIIHEMKDLEMTHYYPIKYAGKVTLHEKEYTMNI